MRRVYYLVVDEGIARSSGACGRYSVRLERGRAYLVAQIEKNEKKEERSNYDRNKDSLIVINLCVVFVRNRC